MVIGTCGYYGLFVTFSKIVLSMVFVFSINIKFIEITEISTGNVKCDAVRTILHYFYLTSPFPGVNGKLNKRQRRRKVDSTEGLPEIIILYLCQYDICHNWLFHICVNIIFSTNTFMFNLGQYLSLCLCLWISLFHCLFVGQVIFYNHFTLIVPI